MKNLTEIMNRSMIALPFRSKLGHFNFDKVTEVIVWQDWLVSQVQHSEGQWFESWPFLSHLYDGTGDPWAGQISENCEFEALS